MQRTYVKNKKKGASHRISTENAFAWKRKCRITQTQNLSTSLHETDRNNNERERKRVFGEKWNEVSKRVSVKWNEKLKFFFSLLTKTGEFGFIFYFSNLPFALHAKSVVGAWVLGMKWRVYPRWLSFCYWWSWGFDWELGLG